MPVFENMMVTVTIFLFFTNAVFLFGAALPGTENGDGTLLNTGASISDLQDMNNKINSIMGASDVFKPENVDINAAINVTGEQKNYLTLFQEWLFGGLDTLTLGLSSQIVGTVSILGTVISLFGATFFGYLYWIDFFIPAVGAFVFLGLAFKAFFFFIQAMWLFDIIYRMFFAGTGTRG